MSNEVCIVCDWKDANPFPTFIEAEVDGLSVKFDWRDRDDGLKELVIAASSASKNDALIALADQIERHSQYDEPATQFQWASKLREISNLATYEPLPAGARDAVADAAVSLRGLAGVIRRYGFCAPAALELVAERLEALTGKADGGDAFRKLYEPDEYEDAFKGRDLKEAMDLAEGIWRIHYTEDAPNFQPATTISGCLSQISNMVTGLDRNHRIPARVGSKATQPAATGAGELIAAVQGFLSAPGTWTAGHADALQRLREAYAAPLAAQPAPVVGGALVGSRFSIDHGIVHDRKTGKHLRGTDEYGDKAADLLAVLHELENEAFAWKYTAKAFDVSTRPAESVAQGGEDLWCCEIGAASGVLVCQKCERESHPTDWMPSISTVEKVRRSLVRLGFSTPESIEVMAVQIDRWLINLCREIDNFLDAVNNATPATGSGGEA